MSRDAEDRDSVAQMGTTARALLGGCLVARPRAALRTAGVADQTTTMTLAARVLGARHLAETMALVTRPGQRTSTAVVATDALHVTSMLLLACVSPRHRRVAVCSAAAASLLGLAAVAAFPEHAARRGRR